VIGIDFAEKLVLQALGYNDKSSAVVVEAFAASSALVNKNKEVSGHGILLQNILDFRKQ
jgi:hypothetical protein